MDEYEKSVQGGPPNPPIVVPEGKMRCGACDIILSHEEWEAHKDTTEHLVNAGKGFREVIDECETKMVELENIKIVRR